MEKDYKDLSAKDYMDLMAAQKQIGVEEDSKKDELKKTIEAIGDDEIKRYGLKTNEKLDRLNKIILYRVGKALQKYSNSELYKRDVRVPYRKDYYGHWTKDRKAPFGYAINGKKSTVNLKWSKKLQAFSKAVTIKVNYKMQRKFAIIGIFMRRGISFTIPKVELVANKEEILKEILNASRGFN
jgi:hypothetical protein